jgi:hypothetical protein
MSTRSKNSGPMGGFDWGQTLGGIAGGMLAGPLGSSIGAHLGGQLGAGNAFKGGGSLTNSIATGYREGGGASGVVDLIGQYQARRASSSPQSSTSRTNFSQLRDDAVAAGFNPLTALRATGGAGNVTTTQSRASLSSMGFLSEALSAGTETWFNSQQAGSDPQVKTAQLNQKNASLSSPVTDAGVVAAANDPFKMMDLSSQPTVWIYLPDGQHRQIPAPVAASLGLEDGSYINAGQYAELVGEIRGEGESLLLAGEIGNAIGVSVFAPRPSGGETLTSMRKNLPSLPSAADFYNWTSNLMPNRPAARTPALSTGPRPWGGLNGT